MNANSQSISARHAPRARAERQVDQPGNDDASPWGHRIMFVLLVLMAFALYGPAVLLQVLAENAAVLAEERRLSELVGAQQRQVDTIRELIDAFQHDPIVNERLALMDLKYQRPGEEIVPVALEGEPPFPTSGPAAHVDAADLALVPSDWPRWSRDAESWARQNHLTRLYISPTVRIVLLLMAGGLLVAAFVLYPPRPSSPRALRTIRPPVHRDLSHTVGRLRDQSDPASRAPGDTRRS